MKDKAMSAQKGLVSLPGFRSHCIFFFPVLIIEIIKSKCGPFKLMRLQC